MDLHKVLLFLHECHRKNKRAVIVTVCAVEGSSMRNPGTIMGVAQDGSFEGSLSGGCIENAVVAEALDVLKSGRPRIVRFGAGSPYLDIRLPCGGGIDLHFCVLDGDSVADDCLGAIRTRKAFALSIGPDGARFVPEWRPAHFDAEQGTGTFGHWPTLELQIIGHGAGVGSLARLAREMGCGTSVYTPDEQLIASIKEDGFQATLLKQRTQTDLLSSDPWTAFVFLFHDHDWEIDLMERALTLPHFYLGAMGGRRAHAMRSEALAARGVSAEQIATIRAPIGVFHSSRDPDTLALSTLAEVIRTYHETDFGAALG
ncbi:MAG: XdhC family protein [Erythrobacter sp.]